LGRTLTASNVSASGPGVAYAYDALGRVTSMTQNGRTLSYGYDAAGNRTTITWPDTSNPLTATYVYDPLNNVTQIEQNGATSGPGLLATYAYDSLGRRTGISRAGGAGMSTSYAYDTVNRLSTLTQTLASSAGTTFTLGYNPANQVISRADSNGAFTVAPSAISLTYTANGLNQYSSITGGTQALSGGPQAGLAYDPQGRIQSVTTSGTTSNFLYDGDFLAEEYNTSGTTTARYVPGPGTDEPVTVYSGASLSYPNWYAADQEGSIIATANSSGTKVASFAYGPYGEPLTSAGAPAWAGARYRYTGQIVIAGAQTYFYKARMYDPETGRFLQTDPAGFGGGVNIYAYVMNDPINGWDPTGTDYWSPGGYYCSSDIGSLDYGIDDGYGNIGYMNGSIGNCEGYSGGGEFGQSSVGGPFGGGAKSAAGDGNAGKPQNKTNVIPKNALICTSGGASFYAPPSFNPQEIQNDGAAEGPINGLLDAGRAVGYAGAFDFQRMHNASGGVTFFSAYTNASNFAVGLYVAGAGYNSLEASAIANGYSFLNAGHGGTSSAATYRNAGIAVSGMSAPRVAGRPDLG
jgi:RHS repeat-associated protein